MAKVRLSRLGLGRLELIFNARTLHAKVFR